MTKKKKPAELAKEVIQILRKKKFDQARSATSNGYPEAVFQIAQKICAGATISHIATFTEQRRRVLGSHFIHYDQTLLHLFASTLPASMSEDEYRTVLAATKLLTIPNPITGKLDFDPNHRDKSDGNAPLHLAVKSADPEMCHILLEGGANPKALCGGGYLRTPAFSATEIALDAGRDDVAQVIQTWIAKAAIDDVIKRQAGSAARMGAAP